MKRVAVLILMAVGMCGVHATPAQTTNAAPGSHGMNAEERFNRLSQELNLNDQQKPKVQAIFEQMRQQVQTAIVEAKTNADTQLQQVLTPEQYQQLQTLWQQSQRQWDNRQRGGQ